MVYWGLQYEHFEKIFIRFGQWLTFGIYMGDSLAQVSTWIYLKAWKTNPINGAHNQSLFT